MISHTQLEYLVAVDRHGNFSQAAAHCHITQPTLSMQIQKLEAELGVTLFDRSRKPVLATTIGRLVIERAYRTLREFRAINDLIHEQREGTTGVLRIGIIPTLGPYLLPRFLPELMTQNPGLQVTVRELLTIDIIEALRRDMLDAGIAATPLAMSGIEETPLFYEPFYGLVAAGHRLAGQARLDVGEVAADEMVLLHSGHCLHGQVRQLCADPVDGEAAVSSRLRFVGGSLEGVMRMVASGYGITMLPELAILTLPDRFKALLRPLRPPVPTRQVSLITHGEGLRTRLLERLERSILSNVPAGLKKRSKSSRIIDVKPA
jgi:LysR family hydrogen peroxide-inducible transcriptional activator